MTLKDCLDIVREVANHTNPTKIQFLEEQGEKYTSNFVYAFQEIDKCVKGEPNIFQDKYKYTPIPGYICFNDHYKCVFKLSEESWQVLGTLVGFVKGLELHSPLHGKPRPQTDGVTRFFYQILDCELTELEIYNSVERLTDNFNRKKLKLLLNDFDIFMAMERDEMEAKYTEERILDAIQRLEERGEPVPYKTVKLPQKDKNGKFVLLGQTVKFVDIEKIFFPAYFFGCYTFKALITRWGNEVFKKEFDQEEKPKQLANPQTIAGTPTFTPEAIPDIYKILKDFFSPADRDTLNDILASGADAPRPLVFLANGNKLAHAFKMLKDHDFITGCEKKELEAWINRNFKYRSNRQIKDFSLRYLNDIISTNEPKCKNPILEIERDRPSGQYLIVKP